MTEEIYHIPLERFHQDKGARFVPFAGWNMPVQYTSIIQEHMTVRKKVGMFDVSHMGEIILTGKDSVAYLNHLLTNDYSELAVGASKYSMMCYLDGGVVDDLIVYRLEAERFLICVNASNCEKDFDWMVEQQEPFEVVLEDQSNDYALLAIQGPEAAEFLKDIVVDLDITQLKRFTHDWGTIGGEKVLVSATGYTGESGFELYVNGADVEPVAEKIEVRRAELDLEHFYCGLGCRDSLRLEAGYPLYGHEISDQIDPISAGLGWTVKLGKSSEFVGKSPLAEIKEAKPAKRVVFFKLNDRRIARQGEAVWSGEAQIGEVLSGTYSPIANVAIGSMLIDREHVKSEDLEVRLRGKPFSIEIVKPPIR